MPLNTSIGTNDVMNTNNCYISICKTKYKNKIVLLSAIDSDKEESRCTKYEFKIWI